MLVVDAADDGGPSGHDPAARGSRWLRGSEAMAAAEAATRGRGSSSARRRRENVLGLLGFGGGGSLSREEPWDGLHGATDGHGGLDGRHDPPLVNRGRGRRLGWAGPAIRLDGPKVQ